ncbi:acyltransferase [Paenibacillus sp. IB182496]|uniref:Acyltransferase n=1 Tax=Paenibacillus sabuli TaxID=2772509 RepID=A0A927GTL4_9BACL|nr:acyltransferase [Paenibacillus sabuli]MBD2846857.1 acyltransferase [Paenibacillus sabuli]
MDAQPDKKEKIPELQLVRAFAILGVLFVHSTSYATVEMTNSGYYGLYNFLNVFMKHGTPTFIFLSSFVLFYNYYSRPLTAQLIGGFYKKRLLYIIVPYLLFSVFYFALLHHHYYQGRPFDETMDSFFSKLLTGKAYTHLYFVFISIQFYVLFPLTLWLFKKAPLLARWAIPIGLAVQWGFVLLNKAYWEVPNKGSWAFSYMAYFMLGACLGIYFPRIKAWFQIRRSTVSAPRVAFWLVLGAAWLTAGTAHVYIWYNARLYGTRYNTTLYEFLWNAHTYLGTAVLLMLAYVVYRKAPRWINRWLERLGALSFGIYLIHPFFLFEYRLHPLETGNSMLVHLWYAGGWATALVLSWIVVSLTARWLPFSWIVFGNLPKPGRPEVTRKRRAPVDTSSGV